MARAIQHENDHLDGTLFIDHARDIEETNTQLKLKNLPSVDINYLLREDELENEIKINSNNKIK